MAEPISRSSLTARFESQCVGEFEDRGGWRVVRAFTTAAEELEIARAAVAIADESARTKILVQGAAAAALLEKLCGSSPPALFQGARFGKGGAEGSVEFAVYRLRPDHFFLSAAPGEDGALMQVLRAHAEGTGGITVTDVTHGRAEFRLIGPASRDLLAKLCGLDFDDGTFPDLACRQSSLAKTKQLLARNDLSLPSGERVTSFSIVGGRSFGAYVWDTTMAAGSEFGIGLLGSAAIDLCEQD